MYIDSKITQVFTFLYHISLRFKIINDAQLLFWNFRCLAGVPGLQGRFCWWLRHSLHGFLQTWRIAWRITESACARGCLWHFQGAFVAPKIPNLDRPERSNLSSQKSTNSLSKSRCFLFPTRRYFKQHLTKTMLVILEDFLSTVNNGQR